MRGLEASGRQPAQAPAKCSASRVRQSWAQAAMLQVHGAPRPRKPGGSPIQTQWELRSRCVHSVGCARKDRCMASGEFRKGRWLDAKQLVRPEFNTRLGVTKPFQRLFDERIDRKWR